MDKESSNYKKKSINIKKNVNRAEIINYQS